MTSPFGGILKVDQGVALTTLLEIVNDVGGVSYSITLLVGGAIVTGALIGDAEYFRLHGEQWARMYGPETDFGRSQQARVAGLGARLQAQHREAKNTRQLQFLMQQPSQQLQPQAVFEYVNLKDATALGHGHLGLWRIRLSAVDGFSLNY